MTEDFAISLVSEELQVLSSKQIPSALADHVRKDLGGLGVPLSEIAIETGSAGYGAEVLTLIAIITAAFLAGKQLDEGLSAWANIGRRALKVVEELRGKYGSVALSEPVALAIALEELSSRGVPLGGMSVIASHTLPVAKGVIPPELVTEFRHQPDRFYVFVLQSEDRDSHLICMRSSGEILEVRRLPTGDWREYLGFSTAPRESDDGDRSQ